MIQLKVVSLRGAPLGRPLSARFGPGGGSIGRAPGNTLVLDDPDRTVSRVHAQVLCRDGRCVVVDRGSNPLLHNGQALGAGNEALLSGGDRLMIGGFELTVTIAAHPGAEAVVSDAADTSASDAARTSASDAADMPASDSAAAVRSDSAVAAALDAASAAALDPALWAAFLRGLNTANGLPEAPTPALMERIGALLRCAIDGTLQLLLARQEFQRGPHAHVTPVAAQADNPLMLSPPLEAALAHLLAPGGCDVIAPEAALRDAYDRLRAHQAGIVAGLRACQEQARRRNGGA